MADFIGQYEVAGRIAVGDQELLLGREPSGKPVSIKRIPPGIGRGSTAKHPNLIEIIERVTEGDRFYLVTEYLEGETLAGLIRRLIKRREKIAYGLAAHMIAEVCDGLHAGHMAAELHYAVSPETVFITYGGDVKLLDLGMSTVDPESPYRSPEQIAGGPLGRQTDVYSLGLVLYELTTLRRVAATTDRDLPVPPPSSQEPDYPKELETVVLKAVEPDAGQRYRSAKDMRDALLVAARALGVDEDPQQSLASKLMRLFGDRISTKRELLDRLRVGMPLGDVVPADVDEEVDVPVVFRAPARLDDPTEKSPAVPMDDDDEPKTELAASAYVDPVTEPKRGTKSSTPSVVVAPVASGFRWGVLVLFVLAIAGGGAGGWWLRLREAAPPPPPADAAVRPDAAPVDAPRLPSSVTITIDSVPEGAKVTVDGEDRGTTPIDLKVPGALEPLAVKLRRDGYKPVQLDVVPDHDQQLHEKLVVR